MLSNIALCLNDLNDIVNIYLDGSNAVECYSIIDYILYNKSSNISDWPINEIFYHKYFFLNSFNFICSFSTHYSYHTVWFTIYFIVIYS